MQIYALLYGYIWQMASTVKAKRSLKHLGPKIWDSIDPSLYDISPPAFKKTNWLMNIVVHYPIRCKK